LSNPYLVAASAIAAGLDGMVGKRELMPIGEGPKEDDSRYQKLPTDIYEALEALDQDVVLRGLLGEEFIRVYLQMKRQEAGRPADEIPAGEIDEYLELY